jgi:hypothetical protein
MEECEECQGHGEIDCPACDSTGLDPEDESVTCEECSGVGSVECTECGGSGRSETS